MLNITQPPPHPLVAASILSADFGLMVPQCQQVLDAGADLLHIDVMDGHFAPNLTMGQDMIRALRKHLPDTFLDVHLMVQKPADYIESFAQAGANLFSFHLEVCDSPQQASDLIAQIHDHHMHAGMVINPPTAPDGLVAHLDQLQLILIMSVVPGKSGQSFMPTVLDKARWLKPKLPATTRLEMDGGLNPTTAPLAAGAGIDVMVTASALFGADDQQAVVQAFHQSNG